MYFLFPCFPIPFPFSDFMKTIASGLVITFASFSSSPKIRFFETKGLNSNILMSTLFLLNKLNYYFHI